MNIIKKVIRKVEDMKKRADVDRQLKSYYSNGQIPWSPGYQVHKVREIEKSLLTESLRMFSNHELPEGYGFRLDERIVEYPWIFSQLNAREGEKILDAGSTFNYPFIVDQPALAKRDLFIHTYYPENLCFWKKRISYVYGDLRALPYTDGYFHNIVCQSTLEHIDMDNSLYGYSNDRDHRTIEKSYEYLKVIKELLRVLKPGGRLLLTFPYGKFENHGFFQQFDSEMLFEMLDLFKHQSDNTTLTFFKYLKTGWTIASQADCDQCVSFNPHTKKGDLGDGAAHSRSIACVIFDKI